MALLESLFSHSSTECGLGQIGLASVMRPCLVAAIQHSPVHGYKLPDDAALFDEAAELVAFVAILPRCLLDGGGQRKAFLLPAETALNRPRKYPGQLVHQCRLQRPVFLAFE